MKTMLTLIVFEIFECRSVMQSAQRAAVSERVQFLVKNQKNIWLFLEWLEK